MAMAAHNGDFVRNYSILQGFDGVVWGIVLLNGLGGLLVAATMKYADNIVKCFAAALAILSGTLLSVPLFGFELSAMFAVGVACTVLATILYSWAPERAQMLCRSRDGASDLSDASREHEPRFISTTVAEMPGAQDANVQGDGRDRSTHRNPVRLIV